MVLIFCCDESFDFQSIGRIFLGICKVGCWGCFDEFNRLDEKILSAVSSQIESIETGLRSNNREIELSDKKLTVHEETGIFITMNPGYAGRSELPENLKKLFRSVSMDSPDMDIIIEVLLTSSGFSMAKELATIIVPLFSEILEKSSKQVHYDFGLRALKSTLLRCGSIKRKIQHRQDSNSNDFHSESKIVYRSIKETISPKLILEDEFIMNSLLDKYFPGISYTNDDFKLIDILEKNAENQGLSARESWIEKVLQFYRIQNTNHGIMLVGNAGSGKTTIWRLLLESITELSRIENLTYVIDCKVMLKDKLYGSLDVITREWVDGLFTSILRKVTSNLRGEMAKRIWIVFDGDIDPEWAENLNSVLDDNKILTLPNGERIRLPENIRLIFEADSLKSTTPATVSRCGMVWLDESLITLDELEKKLIFNFIKSDLKKEDFGAIIKELLTTENLASIIMESKKFKHIMKFNIHRYLETLFTLLSTYYKRYEASLCEDSNEVIYLRAYVTKSLILSLIWAFTGDCSLDERVTFGEFIIQLDCFSDVDRVEVGSSYIDFKVSASSDVNWISWLGDVQDINLEPHQVSDSNTVIPTLDTVRHENLIYAMLNEHRPFLLCGPLVLVRL